MKIKKASLGAGEIQPENKHDLIFLVNNDCLGYVSDTDIISWFRSDHSGIILNIALIKTNVVGVIGNLIICFLKKKII